MEIITALIGVMGAILGALLKSWLERRKASDRSVLELWRSAFDRAAFKGPYQWHSSPERFKEAIEITIKCVAAGVLQTRNGTVLGTAKPKSQLKNSEWRTLGDSVERGLNRVRQLIPPTGSSPSADTEVALDTEREKLIQLLNDAWERVGIPLLPLPLEAKELGDVYPE